MFLTKYNSHYFQSHSLLALQSFLIFYLFLSVFLFLIFPPYLPSLNPPTTSCMHLHSPYFPLFPYITPLPPPLLLHSPRSQSWLKANRRKATQEPRTVISHASGADRTLANTQFCSPILQMRILSSYNKILLSMT